MLNKLILVFFIVIINVFANNTETVTNDKFQLIAKKVDNNLDKTVAKGDVLLTTPEYYIMADELYYFKGSQTAEAFGNVSIVQNGVSQIISEYAYFDFKNDRKMVNPIFYLNYQNKLWVNSEEIQTSPTEQNFDTSTISSCNCVDPAWSMRVSSGTKDVKNQWMHLYNVRLYVGSIPILYFPYFGYPTDNTRRSGLLPPTMGYSSDEGFFYAQPIYFAPADNWDLEFTPQYRAKRGNGIYTTFRYADSKYSNLLLKVGSFDEQTEYREKKSLEHDEHYGFNLDYDRTNVFEGPNSNDELSIWLEWMNDIDYRNLDNDNLTGSTSYGTKRTSYINYYFDTPKWYNGTYFRYYLNTAIDDNDVTLQQLPQYQSHIYTDSLIFDKLTYSTDLLYTNYYREEGITAQKTDLNIPLSYEFSLFDDYIFLNLREDVTASHIHYGLEEDQSFEDGEYIRANHQVSLSTDLMKPYTDIAHSINLSVDYTVPEIYTQNGDIYGVTTDDSTLSSFAFTDSEKTLSVNAKNYFYDIKSKKLLLSDYLSQSYEYKNEQYEPTNLENKITLNYSLGSISNRIIYNQEDKEFVLSSSSFSLSKGGSSLSVTHYRTQETPNTSYSDKETMTVTATYKFTKKYSFTYYNSYDLLNDVSSKKYYKFNINDKCWSMYLKLQDSLVTSSSSTSSAVRQDILYVGFTLKPLGGYVFKKKFDERTD